MINKEDAKKKGINIIDSNEHQDNSKNEIIERIKKIVPNIINSDNVLNIKALSDLIDISRTTGNNQGYELTFAGKGLAKALADTPTKKELKIEQKQSKNFNETGNVIIRGDNIDALKILKQNYFNKIKMIYIDPPYNTASEQFIYNDNFKESDAGLIEKFGLSEDNINYLSNIYGTRTHSGWLSFMYPRLKIARDLLKEDGVIFISIDDNEQASLKIICDEIFGEENFVVQFVWQKKTGASDAVGLANITENILVYVKDISFIGKSFSKNENSFDENRYDCEDEYVEDRGKYYPDNLDRGGLNYSDSMNYGIECPDGTIAFPNGRKKYINDGWIWKWGKEKVKWGIENGFIEFRKSKSKDNGWSVCYKNYMYVDNEGNEISRSAAHKNLLLNMLNLKGASDIKNIFNNIIFKNSKPVELISKLISFVDFDKSDIILDFFAGSGTTAHAVLELNKVNNAYRKFILVQLDELIDEKKSKLSYDFCIKNNFKPVISSITIERINRAGDKLKDDLLSQDLDIGYKVFSLTDKPEIKYNKDHVELFGHRTEIMDTLYNMMSATSQTLNSKIEEIEKDKLYKVNNNYYLLGKCKTKIEGFKDSTIYIDGYSDIKLEEFLNLDVANKENIKIVY